MRRASAAARFKAVPVALQGGERGVRLHASSAARGKARTPGTGEAALHGGRRRPHEVEGLSLAAAIAHATRRDAPARRKQRTSPTRNAKIEENRTGGDGKLNKNRSKIDLGATGPPRGDTGRPREAARTPPERSKKRPGRPKTALSTPRGAPRAPWDAPRPPGNAPRTAPRRSWDVPERSWSPFVSLNAFGNVRGAFFHVYGLSRGSSEVRFAPLLPVFC